MAEQRTPKKLKERLEKLLQKQLNIDHHIFRGIRNPNNYCYMISLLQLFFHCEDFINVIKSKTEENLTDTLLKELYNLFYSDDTKAISIQDFTNEWRGWEYKDQPVPKGKQDIIEFFMYFMNTISDGIKDLFCFKATEKSPQENSFAHLRVIISAPNLKDCISNEINLNTHPTTYPQNLFIQLDRARETGQISTSYVAVNQSIDFNGQNYSFVGAVVFSDEHYQAIIKISDNFFNFNDMDVSPLFFDHLSVYPSSFNRSIECENLLNHNSVLFLYKKSDEHDRSIVHLTRSMGSMIRNKEKQPSILKFTDSDGSKMKFIEIPHKELVRNVVNLDEFGDTDLLGTMKISTDGIPRDTIEPIADNRFVKFRKIFKWVAKVLRNLKEVDQGKLNSMLIKTKLEKFEEEEMDFIQSQGVALYDIIKNVLLEKKDLTFDDVQNHLQQIVDSYECKYAGLLQTSNTKELIFDYQDLEIFDQYINDDEDEDEENQENSMTLKIIEEEESNENWRQRTKVEKEKSYQNLLISEKDPSKILELLSNAADNIQSDEDCDWKKESESDYYSDYYSDDDSFVEKKTRIDLFTKGVRYIRLDGNQSWTTTNNDLQDLSLEYSNDDSFCDFAKTKDVFLSDDEECEENDIDDNQFILSDYDWKSRNELLDADTILDEIREKTKPNTKKEKVIPLQMKSDLQDAIMYEVIRERLSEKGLKGTLKDFAINWIDKNVKGENKHALVQAYNRILREEILIKEENAKRKRKKKGESADQEEEEQNENKTKGKRVDIKEYSLSHITIKHWFQKFKKLSKEEKKAYLKTGKLNDQKKWGGAHNIKINDDALKCLICLVLDFPNMPVKNFTKYLNSQFGPCHEKKVKESTVHKALQSLKFSVKKAHFCPPPRNSIGLRIYRVAWSLCMEEISNQSDVLIGFIDEAGITVSEGRKYGHSFVGVTPMINCPLSDCKISVLSCVVPGFGVLYKFFNSSVCGSDYSAFLRDITRFFRIYICSSNAQIVLIEDNCRIHCTQEVEDMITNLKICVIPTVPYSPALNGVVEGYFGFVKFKHVELFDKESSEATCDEELIRERWKMISDQEFTNKITKSLYCEWKARMADCVMGIPLISGHINIDRFLNDAKRLTSAPVYRSYNETKYKKTK